MNFKSRSISDTQEIARELAKNLDHIRIICLHGELGAGKTTFTKAFLEELGVKQRVISPTYTMVRSYHANKQKFVHIDAYRVGKNDSDLGGIKELLGEKSSIIIIEWPERISDILPETRIDVDIIAEQDERNIEIRRP